MKPAHFLSNDSQVEQIIKGLTLTKSLMVSSIILGEPFTGKKSLVQSLFPHTLTFDANKPEILQHALSQHDELIIYNFESIQQLPRYDFSNKRIIAISNAVKSNEAIEEKFAFIYHMPPLRERLGDIPLLSTYFAEQIREELMIEQTHDIPATTLDLSDNIKSLKASLYREMVTADLSQEALEKLIYRYLYERIEGNNAYREQLGLLERPLIQAGLDRYKSQLKLSSILGLNRNTLRKKIHEHHLD